MNKIISIFHFFDRCLHGKNAYQIQTLSIDIGDYCCRSHLGIIIPRSLSRYFNSIEIAWETEDSWRW